jgi:hypothetical protein
MDGPLFPSKVSSRCPAIMFAVSRTARVPGRIRLLIVSIITINGINMVGVTCGTKCSNMWLVFLIHPNNINLIHIGRARVSVRVRCLVLVKMYGNSLLSGTGLCGELITRPEEFYRPCCVVVCDLETSRIGAPYIYVTLIA